MKRKSLSTLIALFLLIMLLVLTGCSSDEEKQNLNSNSKNSLASKVKIGDYVAYKTDANNTYTSPSEKTGYSKPQTFTTTGEEKWRVLDIKDEGTVVLISADEIKTNQNNTYYLNGEQGYINGVNELNSIAKIYGNGEHSSNARHLTREDINNLIGLEKFAQFYNINLSNYNTDEEKWKEIYKLMDENYGKEIISEDDGTTETVNYYEIKLSDFFKDTDEVYQSLLGGMYWLSNQTIRYNCGSSLQGSYDYFEYGIGYLSAKSSASYNKFNLDARYSSIALNCSGNYTTNTALYYSVRPVVELDSNAECNAGTGTISDPYTIK